MTGERLAWFRVASHLQIPVEELASRITFREFLNWLEYLVWADERTSKQDLYMAQLTAEVRRSYVTKPKTVKVADFIIKSKRQMDAATSSKAAWLGFFNLKPEDN